MRPERPSGPRAGASIREGGRSLLPSCFWLKAINGGGSGWGSGAEPPTTRRVERSPLPRSWTPAIRSSPSPSWIGCDDPSSVHRHRALFSRTAHLSIRAGAEQTTTSTRPMISSGAGGPLTTRSEGPTYAGTATIGRTGWPVPGRDVSGVTFMALRKPRRCFPCPGRGGGFSV